MTKRLIYLEDAIDALAKWFHDDVFGITESDGTATMFKRLRELPSAQPAITCDGCRFVSTYDTDFPCCSCVRREKDYYDPE